MSLLTIQNLSLIQTYQPILKSILIITWNTFNYAPGVLNNQNFLGCNTGRQQAAKASIAASTGNFPGAQ
jgi:hypothetical protein